MTDLLLILLLLVGIPAAFFGVLFIVHAVAYSSRGRQTTWRAIVHDKQVVVARDVLEPESAMMGGLEWQSQIAATYPLDVDHPDAYAEAVLKAEQHAARLRDCA
jgi:hypothetical protein